VGDQRALERDDRTTGGQGSGNPGIAAGEQLVALVDVDDKRLGDAVKKIAAKVREPRT